MEHVQTRNHRLNQKKVRKMREIYLSEWEKHRGAPLDMESSGESSFQREFHRFQRDQRSREEEYSRQQSIMKSEE